MQTDLPHDWREFFEALISTRVRFLVVGALAVGVHAEPRHTDDLDVFVDATEANGRRLHAALTAFGFGSVLPSARALVTREKVWMLGRKPRRIDILMAIDGVTFSRAWKGRVIVDMDGLALPVIGRAELVANKKAAGRPKDALDLLALDRLAPRPAPQNRRTASVARRKHRRT